MEGVNLPQRVSQGWRSKGVVSVGVCVSSVEGARVGMGGGDTTGRESWNRGASGACICICIAGPAWRQLDMGWDELLRKRRSGREKTRCMSMGICAYAKKVSERLCIPHPTKKSPKGWMEKRDREGVERSAAAVSVLGGPR